MAKPTLTTEQGRSSSINVMLPFGRTLPPVDTAVGIYDRQQMCFGYTSQSVLSVYIEPDRNLYWDGPPHMRQSNLRYMALRDGVTAPSEAHESFAIIFIDETDGDLKILFTDGTTKTIVTDT